MCMEVGTQAGKCTATEAAEEATTQKDEVTRIPGTVHGHIACMWNNCAGTCATLYMAKATKSIWTMNTGRLKHTRALLKHAGNDTATTLPRFATIWM